MRMSCAWRWPLEAYQVSGRPNKVVLVELLRFEAAAEQPTLRISKIIQELQCAQDGVLLDIGKEMS